MPQADACERADVNSAEGTGSGALARSFALPDWAFALSGWACAACAAWLQV